MAITVFNEHNIFAVLKLSLSMKLDYFNYKLFDYRGHWIKFKLKCQEALLYQSLQSTMYLNFPKGILENKNYWMKYVANLNSFNKVGYI